MRRPRSNLLLAIPAVLLLALWSVQAPAYEGQTTGNQQMSGSQMQYGGTYDRFRSNDWFYDTYTTPSQTEDWLGSAWTTAPERYAGSYDSNWNDDWFYDTYEQPSSQG